MQKALDGVSIISPRATASDLTLLSAADGESPRTSADKSVETLFERIHAHTALVTALQFVRTIAPDDWVLR